MKSVGFDYRLETANNYMTENMFVYLVVLIFGIFSFLIILFWAYN